MAGGTAARGAPAGSSTGTYLPGDIKPDQVSATLSDGVLTVTVPKSEAARPRRIEISG